MEARPGPPLVVAEPEFLLAVLVEAFDRPTLVRQSELVIEGAAWVGPPRRGGGRGRGRPGGLVRGGGGAAPCPPGGGARARKVLGPGTGWGPRLASRPARKAGGSPYPASAVTTRCATSAARA